MLDLSMNNLIEEEDITFSATSANNLTNYIRNDSTESKRDNDNNEDDDVKTVTTLDHAIGRRNNSLLETNVSNGSGKESSSSTARLNSHSQMNLSSTPDLEMSAVVATVLDENLQPTNDRKIITSSTSSPLPNWRRRSRILANASTDEEEKSAGRLGQYVRNSTSDVIIRSKIPRMKTEIRRKSCPSTLTRVLNFFQRGSKRMMKHPLSRKHSAKSITASARRSASRGISLGRFSDALSIHFSRKGSVVVPGYCFDDGTYTTLCTFFVPSVVSVTLTYSYFYIRV